MNPRPDRPTPGLDALRAHLVATYGDPVWLAPYAVGTDTGVAPLAGFAAHLNETPVPHWHVVTLGFSDHAHVQPGGRFELSCRVPCELGTVEPPRRDVTPEDFPAVWAAELLTDMADYALSTGRALGAGHHLRFRAPARTGLSPLATPSLAGVVLADEPALGQAWTPRGQVRFLQVTSLTPRELHALGAFHAEGVLSLLRRRDPLLLLDPARPCHMSDPAFATYIGDGMMRGGSSHGRLYVELMRFEVRGDERVTLTLEADAAAELAQALTTRLGHRRSWTCTGPATQRDNAVRLVPGARDRWHVEEGFDGHRSVVVELSERTRACLADGFRGAPGTHRWPELPGLDVHVLSCRVPRATRIAAHVPGRPEREPRASGSADATDGAWVH